MNRILKDDDAGAACAEVARLVQAAAAPPRTTRLTKSRRFIMLLQGWGAIDRSRKSPTQSKRRVDGHSVAVRCVGLLRGLRLPGPGRPAGGGTLPSVRGSR